MRNVPGPLAAGDPGHVFLVDQFGGVGRQKVEIAPGANLTASDTTWPWIDVTSLVQWDPGVSISQGRADESTVAQPANCTFTVRNTSGDFTQFSPYSRYFPNLKIDMPVRASLDVGAGAVVRFQGYLNGITPSWEARDNYAVAKFSASGMLRRLQQGTSPSLSAMRRSFDKASVQPVGYWPLEGGTNATVMYDTINNMPTEQVDQSDAVTGEAGAVRFGSAFLGNGSDQVANISGSWSIGMRMPTTIVATGSASFQFSINFGNTVRSGGFVNANFRLNPYVAAKHLTFQLYFEDDEVGHIDVYEANPDLTVAAGPTSILSFTLGNIFDGQPRQFQLDMTASGGSGVAWQFWINDVSAGTGTYTASFSSPMNAAPWRMGSFAFDIDGSNTVGVGHFASFTSVVTANRYTVVNGYSGELATTRLARLCSEEDISLNVTGTSDTDMGPQGVTTLIDLLRECETADAGVLYDGFSSGLNYVTRAALQNQSAVLTLDAQAGEVIAPIIPVADDQKNLNDFIVNRVNGSSAEYVAPEVSSDPTVARRDSSVTVNYQDDSNLANRAAYEVHLQRVDDFRYPNLSVNFATSSQKAVAWLLTQLLRRIDVIGVTNIIRGFPPSDIRLLLQGYTEHWNVLTWDVTLNASSYEVHRVAAIEGSVSDSAWRIDSGSSSLVSSAVVGDTSIQVASTSSVEVWSTSAGDYPRDISVGGAKVTVTAVAGASSPQTFTVNALPYPLTAGWTVKLWRPPTIAL